MPTIEVNDRVYERLDRETQPEESIDDLLTRLLGIDDDDARSEVEAGDVYGGGTNMWTVYDQLGREREDDESLAETFRRLQG